MSLYELKFLIAFISVLPLKQLQEKSVRQAARCYRVEDDSFVLFVFKMTGIIHSNF